MKDFKHYLEMVQLQQLIVVDEAAKKRTTTTIENIARAMNFSVKYAKRIWKKIYRSALKQYGDEGRAIATANSKLKTVIEAKKNK